LWQTEWISFAQSSSREFFKCKYGSTNTNQDRDITSLINRAFYLGLTATPYVWQHGQHLPSRTSFWRFPLSGGDMVRFQTLQNRYPAGDTKFRNICHHNATRLFAARILPLQKSDQSQARAASRRTGRIHISTKENCVVLEIRRYNTLLLRRNKWLEFADKSSNRTHTRVRQL